MITSGLMSSLTDEWETPQDLFDKYDEIYHFTLDAAASDQNHKCPKYYTKADDGLSKMWGGVRMVQSPLRKADREMGAESIRKRLYRGDASSCENGHKMVSRLLSEGQGGVHQRQNPIQRSKEHSPISVNDRSV